MKKTPKQTPIRKSTNTVKDTKTKTVRNICTYGSPGCKDNVWVKAKTIPGKDPKEYRQDPYKNEIRYSDYGQTSEYGWQIDHIKPKSQKGSDNIINLQALSSKTNMQKGGTLVKKSLNNQ
jgi:5-methylcytosine-specific restriction endonuclease McrA